jgi:aerobic-type carbon monoxide dehydrogenase small subunit (CoxS/CutS family)
MKAELRVNGHPVLLEREPMDRLLDLLREQLELIGTKEGCGEGECGACTVMLGGQPALSCLIPLMQCQDAEVQTIEGVAEEAKGFMEEFVASGGVQCGACTPGIAVSSWALLQDNPAPSRDEVQEALAGNLCRCTGYEAIFRSLVGGGPDVENGEEE